MKYKLTSSLSLFTAICLSVLLPIVYPKLLFIVMILKVFVGFLSIIGASEHIITVYTETLGYFAAVELFSKQRPEELTLPDITELRLGLYEIIQYVCILVMVFLV